MYQNCYGIIDYQISVAQRSVFKYRPSGADLKMLL